MRVLPRSSLSFVKQQPSADLTIFYTETAFTTLVSHAGVIGFTEAKWDNGNMLKIFMLSCILECVTVHNVRSPSD